MARPPGPGGRSPGGVRREGLTPASRSSAQATTTIDRTGRRAADHQHPDSTPGVTNTGPLVHLDFSYVDVDSSNLSVLEPPSRPAPARRTDARRPCCAAGDSAGETPCCICAVGLAGVGGWRGPECVGGRRAGWRRSGAPRPARDQRTVCAHAASHVRRLDAAARRARARGQISLGTGVGADCVARPRP